MSDQRHRHELQFAVAGLRGKSFHHPVKVLACASIEPEEQIEALRTMATQRISWSAHPFLKIGQRVRIRGGSLDNAIVLTQHGMLNERGLRWSDEFVRHKILDIIGDLALLGMTLLGRVTAERSGHLLHAALMASLLRNRAAWEIVDLPAPHVAAASETPASVSAN